MEEKPAAPVGIAARTFVQAARRPERNPAAAPIARVDDVTADLDFRRADNPCQEQPALVL